MKVKSGCCVSDGILSTCFFSRTNVGKPWLMASVVSGSVLSHSGAVV